MELKIKAKLDYMETASIAKIARNITGALRLMGIDMDIGTTTADVKEFLDTLRDPNGREFPGYRLKFTGTMTDGELTIQMKNDDFAAVGDQVDNLMDAYTPMLLSAVSAVKQFKTIGNVIDTANRVIAQRFERPIRYGTTIIDVMDRYGFIVGALYRNDGYDVVEMVRTKFVKDGETYFDDVATKLLGDMRSQVEWRTCEYSDANAAFIREMDKAADDHSTYHIGMLIPKCVSLLNPKLHGKPYDLLLVVYRKNIAGTKAIIRSRSYRTNGVSDDVIDLNDLRDDDIFVENLNDTVYSDQKSAESVFNLKKAKLNDLIKMHLAVLGITNLEEYDISIDD